MSKGGNVKNAVGDAGGETRFVQEKVSKFGGETTIKRYEQGKFLGKGGFAKCYEFVHQDDLNIVSAAKIIDKITLTKSRAK